jgi:hypothetical protein
MKGLLIIFVLVVAGVVGLGFYLRWFSIGSDGGDGKGHITLSVDQNKIKEDEKKAEDRLRGIGKAKDVDADPAQASPPVQQPQN